MWFLGGAAAFPQLGRGTFTPIYGYRCLPLSQLKAGQDAMKGMQCAQILTVAVQPCQYAPPEEPVQAIQQNED